MKTIDFLVENGFVLDGSNREKIAAAFDAEITAGLVRAANLTGIHLAAFLRRCLPSDDPVLITADGSTFYKTRSVDFRAVAERELGLLVPGRAYEFARVDEAPMVGAAITALMERR